MSEILIQFSIIIILAAVLGIIARFFKQPVILAYLVTGLILGYFGFFTFEDREALSTFADLGTMFLLFLVGLEMNYYSLKQVGLSSLIIGVGQIAVTFLLGFLLAAILNFEPAQSIYIAIALTLSSTIVVVKLLSDKRELHSLAGKLSIGVLLVQDFVAILLLITLSGIQNGQSLSIINISLASVKALALFFLMLWLGMKVLPPLLKQISRSLELLFISSIAWLFFIAGAVTQLGFSIEIGGFLAGLSLANASESLQIGNRIKPLRDFFLVIFFVVLGSSVPLTGPLEYLPHIVLFVLFVLFISPIIVIIIMELLGYPKRASFLTGVSIAQVSEFSLILAAVGFRLGHIDELTVSIITVVAVITIIGSTYMINHSDWIYSKLSRYLKLIQGRKIIKIAKEEIKEKKPIVIIGFHRTGQSIALNLPKSKILVIEFNPDTIEKLKSENYEHLFGDISDPEILNEIDFESTEVIISTIPSFDDTLRLLDHAKKIKESHNPDLSVIVRADDEREAKLFYKKGADYVMLPQFTSGQYLGRVIALDPDLKNISRLKQRDMKAIEEYNLNF